MLLKRLVGRLFEEAAAMPEGKLALMHEQIPAADQGTKIIRSLNREERQMYALLLETEERLKEAFLGLEGLGEGDSPRRRQHLARLSELHLKRMMVSTFFVALLVEYAGPEYDAPLSIRRGGYVVAHDAGLLAELFSGGMQSLQNVLQQLAEYEGEEEPEGKKKRLLH